MPSSRRSASTGPSRRRPFARSLRGAHDRTAGPSRACSRQYIRTCNLNMRKPVQTRFRNWKTWNVFAQQSAAVQHHLLTRRPPARDTPTSLTSAVAARREERDEGRGSASQRDLGAIFLCGSDQISRSNGAESDVLHVPMDRRLLACVCWS